MAVRAQAVDPALAQARLLLSSMYEQLDETSRKLEVAESRSGMSTRGFTHDHRQRAALRRELYETHRLIDGLHRRFPETDPRLTRLIPSPKI